MICVAGFACVFLHLLHIDSHLRISSLADMIQNFDEISDSVAFVPLVWFPFSWYSFIINSVTLCRLGNIIGYLELKFRNSACSNLVSERSIPSSSNFGHNTHILLPSK